MCNVTRNRCNVTRNSQATSLRCKCDRSQSSPLQRTRTMTAFVAWVGVDARAPASIYLALDSRISWPPDKSGIIPRWDFGRKVFASRSHPDLLAYVGDVWFPAIVLGQLVEAIDHGVMFTSRESPEGRFDQIRHAIMQSFAIFRLNSGKSSQLYMPPETRLGSGLSFLYWCCIGLRQTAGGMNRSACPASLARSSCLELAQ